MICEFDKTGKILWDNALVMDNLETDDLVEQIQVSKLDDKWLLAFLKKGKINLQQVKGSEHVGEKEFFEIKPDAASKPDEDAECSGLVRPKFCGLGNS